MRSDLLPFVLCLLLPACPMVTEGGGESGSSDSSDSGDDGPDSADSADSAPTADDDGPDSTSGGDDESESDDDSSGSDEETGDATTGEPITDFALRFDGSTVARKTNSGGGYGWVATDFTVEAWIEISDTAATGAIFDAQTEAFDAGWSLYLHPKWNALVFSFFNESGDNQIVIGPSVSDIGVGWHHVAATKEFDRAFIHVDGVAVEIADVSPEIALVPVIMTIGSVANEAPLYTLDSVAIDDLRITEAPLYSGNFDAPVVLDGDWATGTRLLLHFDEGEGVIIGDPEISDIEFGIESPDVPDWVPGHD